MKVTELSRDQLIMLKQSMLEDRNAANDEGTSYGELAEADNLISDDEAFTTYAGVEFSEDDFLGQSGIENGGKTMHADCYLDLGGRAISIEEIVAKFGIKDISDVTLCRRVGAGTLKASVDTCNTDFPSIEVDLMKDDGDFVPVSITVQQPKDEPLTTYLYGRNREYVAYLRHDTRPCTEVEDSPRPTRVTVSGNPDEIVEIARENPYTRDVEEV